MTDEEKFAIRDNIERVRENIEKYRDRSLYDGEITLLCATKTVEPEKIAYAVNECGIKAIGENHVQELLAKYEQIKTLPCELHFIGSLQTNKVKYLTSKVKLIHSVDSVRLAAQIDKCSKKDGVITEVLLEYNSGSEENKGGILYDKFRETYEEISAFENIKVSGMMTMAPVCEKKSEYEKYFSQTYQLFVDFFKNMSDNREKTVLSMGMSDSYMQAVKCGATVVRVGSAIFGKRNYLN